MRLRSAALGPSLGETDRLAWCTWLRRHGIDPATVTMPGRITCLDAPARQILYSVGLVVGGPMPDGYALRTVQLEADALPFPPGGIPIPIHDSDNAGDEITGYGMEAWLPLSPPTGCLAKRMGTDHA